MKPRAKPINRSGQHTPNEDYRRDSAAASPGSSLPRPSGLTFAEGTRGDAREESDPINRVPSYTVALRGWLGGGPTPIDTNLPLYNTQIHRPASDTALVGMGAQAAVDAEARAE